METSDFDKLNILLADDSPTMRKNMFHMLKEIGISKCVQVQNGREALDKIISLKDSENSINLVLTDINMPVMDGNTLVLELKSDATLKSIPIIMVSAAIETSIIADSIEKGASEFLIKPFTANQLKSKILKVIL